MSTSKVSIIGLAALWVVAVVGAVGRYFNVWQWWDFVMAVSSLAFAVGLILSLLRARPAPAGLPVRAVLGQPDFWGRAALILRHFALGCALAVPSCLFRALAGRLGQGGIAGGGIFLTGLLLSLLPMVLLGIKRRAVQASGYLFLLVLVPQISVYLA